MTTDTTPVAADALAELRAKAEAATPGPWRAYRARLRPKFGPIVNEVQCDDLPIVTWLGFDESRRSVAQHTANAVYIASFDPPTALALLAEVERLKRDASMWELQLRGASGLIYDIEQAVPGWRAYRDLADAVTCRLADLVRERDEAIARMQSADADVERLTRERDEADRRAGAAETPATEIGWLYFNEDAGTEFSVSHPVHSGECPDAKDIRPATACALKEELLISWRAEADAEAEVAKLRERVAALEAGLKPFADISEAYSEREDDDFQVWHDFDTLGSSLPLRIFRAARALIEEPGQ